MRTVRRTLRIVGVLTVALTMEGSQAHGSSTGTVARDRLLDIASPERHCNQNHDHFAVPTSLDTNKLLDWSLNDTGFNEAAGPVLRVLLALGMDVPVAGPIVDVVAGNLWKRNMMMSLAIELANTGQLPLGVLIATASQWHNCHAFKWLIAHPDQTAKWLLQQ